MPEANPYIHQGIGLLSNNLLEDTRRSVLHIACTYTSVSVADTAAYEPLPTRDVQTFDLSRRL